MKYIVIVFFLMSTCLVYSQTDNEELKSANKQFEIGNYYGALKMYNLLYLEDAENKKLNYSMGVCNYHIKNYKKAEQHFLKSNSSTNIELLRYKASIAHINMEFNKALKYYNAYKLTLGNKELSNEEINTLVLKVKYAEIAVLDKRNVLIQNVGSAINTATDEYVPLISADGRMLFFTSRREGSAGGKLDPNGRPFEDVYMSISSNNVWMAPSSLTAVNTNGNDACVGLSADGQSMFVFKPSKDLSSGNLYQSRMGLEDWGTPTKLSAEINSEYTESSASISLDDKILFFSSDKPGGFGGKDIYKVLRLPNGKWSRAFNLGPTVNTPYDEDAPFIHSDKKTLYFSSKGHSNMGGYDIFKTVYEKHRWSAPENLKCPINTVLDDIFYVVSANGKVGYYSSSRDGGYGGQDIYKVLLKDEFVSEHILQGIVLSKKGDLALLAKITLIENESKTVKGVYESSNNTGSFIMLVNPKKTYSIIIESDDYHSYTTDLDFDINSSERIEFKLERKGKRDK